MEIKKNEIVPLHIQLTDKLIKKIEAMNFSDKLPSERQLCEDYNVSRTTVRQALNELKLNGYINKVQGKGNFVAVSNSDKQNLLDYYSFTKQTLARNMIPKVKILEFHKESPNEILKEKMELKAGDKVIKIVRLRLADDTPMIYETTFIPFSIFATLKKKQLETMALYDIFEKDYNRKVCKVVEQFSAVNIFKKEAEYLGIPNNSACLKIRRHSYSATNEIIELTYSYARPDQFIYKTSYNV
ncbi:MAG: GntR family transcriptional regulator [Fusobacterium sp.]|nr:GntR family transcriptional regulator [Fusobacterium sp.]